MTTVLPSPTRVPAISTRSHERIPQLDAMRGVAALVVGIGHGVSLFPWTDLSFTAKLLYKPIRLALDGAAMVDFFFVLSGFVLALPHFGPNGRPFDIIDFVVRRATRIFPAFWAAMLLALLLRLISGDTLHQWASTESGQRHWSDPISAPDLLRQLVLVFGLPKIHMLNAPIWSICVEVQVAIILPLFFFLIGFAKSSRTVVAMCGLSLLVAHMIGPPSPLIFLPLFVIGVATAKFRIQINSFVQKLPRSMLLGLSLLAMALIYNRIVTGRIGWRFPDLGPELISGFGATLLIVFADARDEFKAFLLRPPLLLLGKVSYSFYLFHLPLYLFAFPHLYRVTGSAIACIFIGVIASITLSWIVFYLIEQPGISVGRWLAKKMAVVFPSTSVKIVEVAQAETPSEYR